MSKLGEPMEETGRPVRAESATTAYKYGPLSLSVCELKMVLVFFKKKNNVL